MARTPFFEKKGKVSLWLGVRKPKGKVMEGVDIPKTSAGCTTTTSTSRKWRLSEIPFPGPTVAEILRRLSYCSSFLEPANHAAAEKRVTHAYWALAQYEFAYDPKRVRRAVAKDP